MYIMYNCRAIYFIIKMCAFAYGAVMMMMMAKHSRAEYYIVYNFLPYNSSKFVGAYVLILYYSVIHIFHAVLKQNRRIVTLTKFIRSLRVPDTAAMMVAEYLCLNSIRWW